MPDARPAAAPDPVVGARRYRAASDGELHALVLSGAAAQMLLGLHQARGRTELCDRLRAARAAINDALQATEED